MGELIVVLVGLAVIAVVLISVLAAERKARKALQEFDNVPLGIESAHAHRFTDKNGRVDGYVRRK